MKNPNPLVLPEQKLPSLEALFKANVFDKLVDVNASIPFEEYLTPNEDYVRQNAENLKMTQTGLLVSVGTERSFFNLIMCDEQSGPYCQGLAIKDINPRVKAYTDFITLLLRISSDVNDFRKLAFEENVENRTQRLEEIKQRLDLDKDIPSFVKKYYQDHLNDFAKVYYGERQGWRNGAPSLKLNSPIDYHVEPQAFVILQRYAREGKIISSIGDIGDLMFLKGMRVNILDVSNIPEYSALDIFITEMTSFPRIIWTTLHNLTTSIANIYSSFSPTPLKDDQRQQMKETLKKFQEIYDELSSNKDKGEYPRLPICLQAITKDHRPIGYFAETLQSLTDHLKQDPESLQNYLKKCPQPSCQNSE